MILGTVLSLWMRTKMKSTKLDTYWQQFDTKNHSSEWYVVHVWVDHCAHEHVCSPQDFEWIASEPSRNPHLISASGHKLKHYGEQAVPMRLRDGRKIWITFRV